MRLLLPQLDLERGGYGMKEKKMAEFYIKAIPLAPKSATAKKLTMYKHPRYAGGETGDFPNCLYAVLERRCIRASKKSIGDANADLVRLQSECATQQLKKQWFEHLMANYSATEQKWLVRIILKDLKCGVRHESCLKAFHPQALDIYNMTSSLSKVCECISNPQSVLLSGNGGNLQIELFRPIKPMLASRQSWHRVTNVMQGPFGIEIKFDGERVMAHYRRNDKIMLWSRNGIDLEKKYGYVKAFEAVINQQFICDECILDGEMMAWDDDLGSFIPFGSNRTVVQQHNEQQQQQDEEQQNEQQQQQQHLCYIAFDILMINGEITMDLVLSHRRKLMENAFKPKKTYLEMTKLITGISDTQGIMEALDNALQDHHEGIIVKALNSTYQCNKRGNDWIKLKPDYVDDMISSLDLLILGGYFGEGRRRVGNISHFLLGCKKTKNEGNHNNANDAQDEDEEDVDLPTEFYTFCKVGSGYNIEELKQLQRQLQPHWKVFKRSELGTPKLAHFMRWQPHPDDLPDVWIEPQKSVIVELLANEIVLSKNNKFEAGLTVRFPRCKRFRYDKAWYDCVSLNEIQRKFDDKKTHHHARTAAEIAILMEEGGGDGMVGAPKRKKRKIAPRNIPTLMDKFRPADISNVEVVSTVFEHKEFCVLNAYENDNKMAMMNKKQEVDAEEDDMNIDDDEDDEYRYTKQELEKLIVANGGIITQNPLILSTDYLIAERITPRVSNIIASGTSHWNIIRPLWLIDCIENKRIMPLAPMHIIYSTQSTSNLLRHSFDRFGDHYERPINVDELKEYFKNMDHKKYTFDKQSPQIKIKNENGIDAEVKSNSWLKEEWQISDDEEMMLIGGCNRFRRCTVYVDNYEPLSIDAEHVGRGRIETSLGFVEQRLKMYGARISKYLDVTVTHVVVDNDERPRPRLKAIHQRIKQMMTEDAKYKWRPYVVTAKWVDDSIRSPVVIDDYHKYAPRTLSFPQRRN